MTVRILCRASGHPDVVLELQPGFMERVDFGTAESWTYPPSVAILLLVDDNGVDVEPRGMNSGEPRPASGHQLDLLGGAA